jgi:hypothetical protein
MKEYLLHDIMVNDNRDPILMEKLVPEAMFKANWF